MHKISERIGREVKQEATMGEKNGKRRGASKEESTKQWRKEDAKMTVFISKECADGMRLVVHLNMITKPY